MDTLLFREAFHFWNYMGVILILLSIDFSRFGYGRWPPFDLGTMQVDLGRISDVITELRPFHCQEHQFIITDAFCM